MYPGKSENLYLTVLTKEADRRKHGGYRYLITTPSLAHSAFRTRDGLRRWMADRSLTIGKRAAHLWHTLPLVGHYVEDMTMDEARFASLRASPAWRESYTLSNGDYTPALIRGHMIVYLNPNCKREVLTYRWE